MAEIWGAAIAAAGAVGGAMISKPRTARLREVDDAAVFGNALATNRANLPEATRLAGDINDFNQDEANALMEKALPGYGVLQKKFMERATMELENPYELPKEVADNISRLSAERGFTTGGAGQFRDFSLTRDFGINSLQYGQARIAGAQGIFGQLANMAPRVNPASPLAFMLSPERSLDRAYGVASDDQAIQQGAYNASAKAGGVAVGAAMGAFGNWMNQTRPVTGDGKDPNNPGD
jgi:hypothetical protein